MDNLPFQKNSRRPIVKKRFDGNFMLQDVEDKYAKMNQEDILKEMQVDPQQGLSSSTAKERLQKNGPNSLEEKEIPFWKKFLSSVKSPIAWMILAAAILSGLLKTRSGNT